MRIRGEALDKRKLVIRSKKLADGGALKTVAPRPTQPRATRITGASW